MKRINFLYEFITPNGVLPLGYQKTDLPIIFSEINDVLIGVDHATIRTANTPKFRVSSPAYDIFDIISDYFEPHKDIRRVLLKDLSEVELKNDYNIFAITSTHDQSIVEYISGLDFDDMFTSSAFSLLKKHDRVKLVFIDNKEGGFQYPDKFFKSIHTFVDKHKFNKNKIIFITNTSNIKEIYENYLKKSQLDSFMICESINFYVSGEPGKNIVRYENTTKNYLVDKIVEHDTEYSLDMSPSSNLRNKHFLCMNRNSGRLHRPKLILKLIQEGIFDKGLSSLLRSEEFDRFCEKPENIDYKTNIKEKYPFVIDYENADYVAGMHNYFTKKEMWNDTYFSIVAESCIETGPVFITEKVVRPMIYFHPFIVYGNPNTLSELRKLGFKTFPEFFDESYDLVENEDERLSMIVENIKRVSNMTLEEVHKLYNSVYPKLVHNRNLLTKMAKDNFVGNKFLDTINL